MVMGYLRFYSLRSCTRFHLWDVGVYGALLMKFLVPLTRPVVICVSLLG